MKVHSRLGPRLLESTYKACLVHEMRKAGLRVDSEVPITIEYDDLRIDRAYRADLVVNESVLIELKAVDDLKPIYDAQILTYLKLTGLRVGLLINFNAVTIPKGLRRLVL